MGGGQRGCGQPVVCLYVHVLSGKKCSFGGAYLHVCVYVPVCVGDGEACEMLVF